MAVLKHIAIKNADYSAAVCYLKYQHDERHLKPLLDENGSMMLRSEFHMNGVNCNPDTFDLECEMLNDQYRKNYRCTMPSFFRLLHPAPAPSFPVYSFIQTASDTDCA